MALRAFCPPCEEGNHAEHYEVVKAVPEGMLGGVRCYCKGECAHRCVCHLTEFCPVHAGSTDARRIVAEYPDGAGGSVKWWNR